MIFLSIPTTINLAFLPKISGSSCMGSYDFAFTTYHYVFSFLPKIFENFFVSGYDFLFNAYKIGKGQTVA